MKLTKVSILNFKALKRVDVELTKFTCLIGENNAGKSSVLQAVKLFFDGGTLKEAHFHDPTQPVRVELVFTEIADADLDRLVPEHRLKISPLIKGGKLTLARVFPPNDKSALRQVLMMPTDARFSEGNLNTLLSGRVTAAMRTAVETTFPEMAGATSTITTIDAMRQAVKDLADGLPIEQLEARDVPLATGIDSSISTLLPEPIYIPAVKDLADDVKTAATTPFGKILSILLNVITPKLAPQAEFFSQLNAKLNRVVGTNGESSETDRLSELKLIETTVERYVRESFADVALRIEVPPPQLKTILSGAQIQINDGVEGLIDTKGDGLKRAVVFSVLRSYVDLNQPGKLLPMPEADGGAAAQQQPNQAQALPLPPPYLLLFEEPELYLYPKAQQILFEALSLFSQTHPVLVTTHSPAFFGPDGTTLFIKMRKRSDPQRRVKPHSEATPVDVSQGDGREQFQLICYENNNIAFFADRVVLVEGDSDHIVVPHLADLLRPGWSTGTKPLRIAKIGGKSNIVRYKKFFERFAMTVHVLTDLDFLLGPEFTRVAQSADAKKIRDELLQLADAKIEQVGGFAEPTAKNAKKVSERADIHSLWKHARGLKARYDKGEVKWAEVQAAVDAFFAWERYWPRRDLLEAPPTDVRAKLMALLEALRLERIYVWERGAIEGYYPTGVTGDGKPLAAIEFCKTVTTPEQARRLSAGDHKDRQGQVSCEFDAVLSHMLDT